MALAEVLDLTPSEAASTGDVLSETAFGWALSSLSWVPVADRVKLCGDFRRELDRVEALALAEAVAVDDRAGRRLLDRQQLTKRDVLVREKRARAIAAHPVLGDRVAAGELSGPQLDVVAVAMAKADDPAAVVGDVSLLDRIGKVGPEQGTKIMKRWADEQRSRETVEAEHARCVRLRTARRFDTADGLGAITFEGDHPMIDAIWADILADADRLYNSDGGRDTANAQHPRTYNQRLFDATCSRLTGTGPSTTTRGGARPAVVITAELETLLGDKAGLAEQIGTGPIADIVLQGWLRQAALGHADLFGAIFHKGSPLWFSRGKRHATAAQILALIVRDRGCVLCGAHPNRCEAHHLTPWNAPARGPTDIDQLALLCQSCHHWLHDNTLTLYQDSDTPTHHNKADTRRVAAPATAANHTAANHTAPNHTARNGQGIWRTRPARPEEIP